MEDYRLKFNSNNGTSFLQIVKGNKEMLDFFTDKWTTPNKPNKNNGN